MIIDHCYEGVVKKLTSQGKIKQISDHLLGIKRNDERVLFVYDLIKGLNSFPKVQEVKKSANISTDYRNQGNKYYKNKDYLPAWQYYNLSLLYAPLNSDTYCLAISNRSLILYYLGKYEETLSDIALVRSLDYPDNLSEKLNIREEMCKKAMCNTKIRHEGPPDQLLVMKGERDPTYLCASSKLKVEYTENMGRHVIAKEDIKVGEILAEEDPYFTLLIKTQILFACSYCLSRSYNLIPCENCCFSFFCSEECKSKAFKEYHEVECPLMPMLIDMDFTKLELLALRMTIKARNDHTNWNSLFKTMEEAEKNMKTELHGQVKIDNKWVYDSKYYAAHHTLATNVDKRSISDIFQKAVTAAVFLKFLSDNTKFLVAGDGEDIEKIRKCVAGTLLLHLMTSPTNMHAITANVGDKNGLYLEELNFASGSYAFHSLLNHSCAPNVVRFSQLGTGTMKLFALRPIKKGMQIFDNYGMHHAMEDRISRHTSLKFQYKFTCACEACVENWPMYLSMGFSQYLPKQLIARKNKILSENVIIMLQKGDLKTAVKIYESLCQLCEDLDKYAPCKELCDCQESLKQCMAIFGGLIPYGHKQTVQWKAVP